MMKTFISVFYNSIFVTLIFLSTMYAQIQSTVTAVANDKLLLDLKFEKQSYTLEGKHKNVINYFNAVDESTPNSPILPSKTFFIAIPPSSKVKIKNLEENSTYIESVIPKSNPKVKLTNDSSIVYNQTQIDLEYYKDNIYPLNKYEIIGYSWIRDYYCVVLKLNTHRYNWSKRQISVMDSVKFNLEFYDLKPYKINKTQLNIFDSQLGQLIFNYNEASEFRSFRPSFSSYKSIDDWIDFNAEYLKIGVSVDGIYRISKGELENFNINVGNIDPLTYKFFLKGNEIPIFVAGEDDGSFDDSDFIEFYGSMNYAEGDHRIVNQVNEPYSEYIDKYSDTTIYWLTWNGDNGLRTDTSSYLPGGIPDTLNYYTDITHYEENIFLDYSTRNLVEWQNPEWIYNESWIWGNQGVGTSNRNFNVSNLVDDQTAKAFFRIRSFASDVPGDQNAHNFGLSINSNPTMYDSGYINKYEQKILVAEFPSILLQEGQNTLKTHSFPVENSNINLVQRDWYEIEYPRFLSLINDSLKFKFSQPNLNSLQLVKITNAQSSNHILYKIPYYRRISNLLRVNDEIYFADTIKSGDEFFISTEDQIKKPIFYYKKQFEDLTSSNIQSDYILISHPAFETEVNEYLNFINDNYNVSTKYVNVLDIYDQFNYGFFSPEPIKEFLTQANLLWSIPKPSYVFFVGEANYDYHNYKQIEDYAPNYVPSFGHPVSDNWFAIWDSVFTIPQMFVGRLPVKTREEFSH